MSSLSIGQLKESLTSLDSNEATYALTRAQKLDSSCRGRDCYGFAKAVYVHYRCPDIMQWQVRTLQINFPTIGQQNSVDKLFTAARSQLKVIYSSVLSGKETYKDESGFLKLLDAVRGIIEFVNQKAQTLIKPEEIIRKLNKLIIYLSQATSWPFPLEKNSIENVIRVFSNYSHCLLQGHLDPSNQFEFKKFVCSLNKALHEESIGCYEIGIKILTKSIRNPTLQRQECERIKKLVKIGLERIHAPKRKQEMRGLPFEENVNFFCIALAFHAYVYKQDGNLERALSELAASVDQLVAILCAYDREHPHPGWPGILFNFTLELLEYIEDRYGTKFCGKRDIASLIWTFEVLVNNNSFIHYMRTQFVRKELITGIVERLLFSEKTWRAAMAFLIGLADHDVFEHVLKEKIKRCARHQYGLNQPEINWIFEHLNNRLFECDNCLLSNTYKNMYVTFLNHLHQYDALHTLKPYAMHPTHQKILCHNLTEIGFDLMADAHLPLDSFFGNVVYQILRSQLATMSRDTAQKPNVQGAIVRLFAHSGEYRVEDSDTFKRILAQLLSDFDGDLEVFGEIAICAIGKSINEQSSMISGNLASVETWLSKTVIPLYDQIRRSILECVAVKISDSILVSDLIARQESCLISALKKESVRKQVADFAEAFVLFYRQDRFKTELDQLLRVIFKRMSQESTLSFETHLFLLTEFMQALPLYFKRSEEQMRFLYYSQGVLDIELVQQLNPSFLNSNSELQLTNPYALRILSELASSCWIKKFEKALLNCPLEQMGRIPFRFLEIERGKAWECPTSQRESTIILMRNHRGSIGRGRGRGRGQNIVQGRHLYYFEAKKSLLWNLLAHVHAISFPFAWPNQVLALDLALYEKRWVFLDSNKTNTVFLKMGVGQGKSTSAAMMALVQSKKGYVFVLTRYPHLAKQGYAIGKTIFDQQQIESICISEPLDSLSFSEKCRIIYADIESLDAAVKELMLKVFQEVAIPDEIEFLRMVYGFTGEIRVILDEYDLILEHDKQKVPLLEQISADLMPYDPKTNFQHTWPLLERQIRAEQVTVSDAKTQKIPGEKKFFQKGHFHLPLYVWRLSSFLQNAKHVVGLASTANENDSYGLTSVTYREIPYLQNTSLSTMPIQGLTPCSPDTPAITCLKKINFDSLNKNGPLYIVEENVIQSYCNAILEHIEVVRQERKNTPFPYRRPVLILIDPNFACKNPENCEVKTLRMILKTAFEKAALPFEELIEPCTLGAFQKIGQSGSVTLSAVKYGFGTDIQVDPVIEEGLHIIVATSVPQSKFLEHMIGRTGRMGNHGSYSAITIGGLIRPVPKREDRSGFYEALHQITAMFVKRLTSSDAQVELTREWLLFLGRTFANGRQIEEQKVKALCGDFYQKVVAEQYLSIDVRNQVAKK